LEFRAKVTENDSHIIITYSLLFSKSPAVYPVTAMISVVF